MAVDDAVADLLRAEAGTLIGRPFAEVLGTTGDMATLTSCLRAIADGDGAAHAELTVRTSDGEERAVDLVCTPAPDGTVTAVLLDRTQQARDTAAHEQAERRWLSLVRNGADIVFTTDADGALTSTTSALPERLGWQVEEVVGRTGLSFIHPDDRRTTHQAWIDVSSGAAHQAVREVRLLHADGTIAWARVVVTDLRDDPDVAAIVGNVTDITRQKQEESRRRHEEQRFRARFDQSQLPQALLCGDGTFELVNDALCAMIGRGRDELVGRRPSELNHPDDTGAADSELRKLLDGRVESVHVLRLFEHADGTPVPAMVDAIALRDETGALAGCAASLQDLRPLHNSETARTEQAALFDVIAERSTDVIMVFDADLVLRYASPAGRHLFGDSTAATSEEMWKYVHPDDLAEAREHWDEMLGGHEARTWRYRARRADDSWGCFEQTSTNLLDTGLAGVVSNIRDVSAEAEALDALRVSEGRYRAIAETAEEGLLVISPTGYVTFANARVASLLGLDIDYIYSVPVWTVLDPSVASDIHDKVLNRFERGSERYEVPYPHPDGGQRVLWVSASPMPAVNGRSQGSLAMISDITENRRSESALRHAALHDPLTKLPNRASLMQHLERHDLTDSSALAILFVDLDHFKDVNDGRGHTAGDEVLVEVADRLRAASDANDAIRMVARFGGDEFVLVMHDVDETMASETADVVRESLSAPYSVGSRDVRVGATVGVAVSPADSVDDLLRFADTAMYAAKADGRGRVRLFDSALAQQAEERYVLGAELQTALTEDGLHMEYQPIIDLGTGRVAGIEALARWKHPTRGTVPAERFIALAELNGTAAQLDRWVVRRAMTDVADIKADGTMPADTYVAINLSGQSLSDTGLDAYIAQCAHDAALPPETIGLEITESALMADTEVATDVLQRLRDHGFGIAIDDFGTGFSSMTYLRDLPITALKIDRGFVSGIPEDAHSLAIVTSMLELAHSLGLAVVAEGVETPTHLRALLSRSCPLAQGWLWSASMTTAELRETGVLGRRFDVTDPS